MTARYIVGETRDVTASLPDGSVDLILTSPPFLALRSYLPADHPDKGREIGSEATPADFLGVLLELTQEWRRVLAPHGSICVELGDTFSGSGGAGGDYGPGGMREGQPQFKATGWAGWDKKDGNAPHFYRKDDGTANLPRAPRGGGAGWPLDKSLCMIPQLYAASLAYGRNLLRPEQTIEPWRVRNVVAWCRPNPPVGALGDKFRPATSYMTVACVSRTRWFDLDAVRTMTERHAADVEKGTTTKHGSFGADAKRNHSHGRDEYTNAGNPAGAPPLDWWNIPTHPYPGSHYATWPPDLCVRPIKAMCPLRVCTTCGEPLRRIVEAAPSIYNTGQRDSERAGPQAGGPGHTAVRTVLSETWSDCGHNTWRPGVVLDPFAGSGTTLAVTTGHGRDAIGIDLDQRNADLARDRIGPLMCTVEHFGREAVA